LAITFLICGVQIKTLWLDVRYPQQATVREWVKPVKNIGLNLRLQLLFFF